MQRFGGPDRVAVYGSCGSSPEHWLKAEPVFWTPCGYRETHGNTRLLKTWKNGKPPPKTRTPKIEDLLQRHRPELVIVQLGTNHFTLLEDKGYAYLPQLAERYERFIQTIRQNGRTVRQFVWITPPDSSKYASRTEEHILRLIRHTAERHGLGLIDSSRLTNYQRGITGSDGVHYGKDAGYAWADRVIRQLSRGLSRP